MATVESAIDPEKGAGKPWLARHALFSFFVLAFLISWLIALPPIIFELPFKPFQTAGAFGPFFAAVIVSAGIGRPELAALARRMTNFRVGISRYLIAIFGYVLLYLLVAGLSGAPLAGALGQNWSLIFTAYIPALLTTFLINAIGEETGWTGFALYNLQQKFHPALAAVLLGFVWALWHLPAYFVPSEMGAFNPVGFVFFILLAIFTRVLWTWMNNISQNSGVIAVLLHASSNAVSLVLIVQLLPAPTADQMAISGLYLLGILFLLSLLILIFTRGRLAYQGDSAVNDNLP